MRALEIAARQHGVVIREQALAAGMSRRQLDTALARGILVAVHRGVYRVGGSRPAFAQAVLAACLASRGVASNSTAATLWEMRGWATSTVHVTVAGRRQPELAGVAGHCTRRLDRLDVVRRGPIPLTSPARTLLDLGAIGPPEAVESALEDSLHRRLVTRVRLEALLDREGQGRPGVATLRAILAGRGPGAAPTESVLEDAFVRLLRDAGLPQPVRQYRIAGSRIDFAYPGARLAIELDGRRWHSTRSDLHRDRSRSNLLTALGWRLLRFGWDDVHQRSGEVATLVADLSRAEGA